MTKKLSNEELKLKNKQEEEAKRNFSHLTIQLFNLNNQIRSTASVPEVSYRLEDEIKYLESRNLFESHTRINKNHFNSFFLNGRFSSIISYDSLRYVRDFFYDKFREQNKVNDLNFISNLLYENGLYYEYESSTDHLKNIYDNHDFKSTLRNLRIKYPNLKLNEVSCNKISQNEQDLYKISQKEVDNLKEAYTLMTKILLKDLDEYIELQYSIDLDWFKNFNKAI